MHIKPTVSLTVVIIFSFVLISNTNAFSLWGPPKIDGTSDAAFKESMEKVQNKLPEDKKKLFINAVQTVMLKDFGNILSLAFTTPEKAKTSAEELGEKGMKALHGKTADEIIIEAALLNQQTETKRKNAEQERMKAWEEKRKKTLEEIKQAELREIKELQSKEIKAEKAKAELLKFEITSSRFHMEKEKYGPDQPVIDLVVSNGLAIPISRAYFSATLQSPGRSVPWYTNSFNYKIPGGIEPGEKLSWSLAPNKFSEWGKVDTSKDALLTLEVLRLEDAQGKTIDPTEEFSTVDQHRLDTLKAKYQ